MPTTYTNQSSLPDGVGQGRINDRDWLWAVLFLILGIIGLMISRMPEFWFQLGDRLTGTGMGTVKVVEGEVRVRERRLPYWMDLDAGTEQKVYKGGAVFTGKNGEALIELESGVQAKVLPNSLVAVEQYEKETVINIERGNIKIEPVAKPRKIKVRSKAKEYTLDVPKASSVSLQVASQGEVLFSGTGTDEIKVDGEVVPTTPQPRMLEVHPMRFTTKLKGKSTAELLVGEVVWGSVKNAARYELEFPDGDNVQQSTATELDETNRWIALRNIEKMNVSYVIKAYDSSGNLLAEGQERIIIEAAAPELKEVVYKTVPNKDGDDITMRVITWEKTSLGRRYEFQLSKAENFREIELERVTEENYIVAKINDTEDRYVRMRAIYDFGPGPWSEPKKVSGP
jgi:hypothetical protein